MSGHELSRRDVLKGGGAALAGLSVLRVAGPALASDGEGEVVPWLDQPAPNPVPDVVGRPLVWEELDSFITPNEKFFTVKHYAEPHLDANAWRLSIGGLVERPIVLSLADLKAHSRRVVTFTLECSGNTGLPFFIGGVGNAAMGRSGAGARPTQGWSARPRRRCRVLGRRLR